MRNDRVIIMSQCKCHPGQKCIYSHKLSVGHIEKHCRSGIPQQFLSPLNVFQTKIEIQKALEQDSTVYEYDSIYDDMKEKSKKKIPANVAKADKQKKVG